MTFTIFQTKDSLKKFPESPYDDNSFVFKNVEIKNNFGALQLLSNSFTLYLPLDLNESIRCRRNTENLSQVLKQENDYIIFDFQCSSKYNLDCVVNYFKDTNCIFMESRSYNGFDNFNIKGVIRTEPLDINERRRLQTFLKFTLRDYGSYSDDVIRVARFNAPLLRSKVIFNNENGEYLKKVDIKIDDFITKIENVDFELDKKLKNRIDICLDVYIKMGFKITSQYKDRINFKKYDEELEEYDNDYYWFKNTPCYMFHKDKFKWFNIFNVVKKQLAKFVRVERYVDYDGIKINNSKLEYNDVIDNTVEKFIRSGNGVLTLRSFMGSGKTLVIKSIVNKLKQSDLRILVVTSRISLALFFARIFDMKIYLEDKDIELNKDFKVNCKKYRKGDSLVCQYDSLHYYAENLENFDVVILDEFMSLMFHSINNLTNNSQNDMVFYNILKKKILISDAFLCNYIFRFIKKPGRLIYNIINESRDSIELREITDINTFKYFLINSLRSKQKISISVTSRRAMHYFRTFLENYGYSVQTISSETGENERKEIVKHLETEGELKWDVILYTPVINVGVSILRNIKYHFHYDSGFAVDSINSIQMIRRTRKAEVIFYYIGNHPNFTSLSQDEIEIDMRENRKLCSTKDADFNYIVDEMRVEITSIGKMHASIKLFLNYLKVDPRRSFRSLLGLNFDMSKYKLVSKKYVDFKN